MSSLSSSTWTLILPLYVGYRIWLANRMPLMDCDEVYNYWEPLHYMLFSSGFQTWEYANEFALRTYAYLTPLWALSKVFQSTLVPNLPDWIWPLLTSSQPVNADDTTSKVALFVLLRSTLAASMALAEVMFCKALAERPQQLNGKTSSKSSDTTALVTSLVTGGLLLSSAGMSHASGALLPSSTLTFLWLIGAAAFLKEQHALFISVAVTATLAIGWPFGVLMFVPLGLAVLVREIKSPVAIISKILVITAIIQGAVMHIDKAHYGKWVSPVWNILMYNTKAGGDELYGIEPTSYYIKNLVLNFNYAVVGILVLPILLWKRLDTLLVVLSPMYIWLAVVVPRPHKEERFLFPIYPCICLGAAIFSVNVVNFASTRVFRKQSPGIRTSLLLQVLLWTPSAILSASRSLALSKYYTAPLQVYSQIQNQPEIIDATVCTCGEWYRFPSSFYLPTTSSSSVLRFLPSSFQGQLPQPFTAGGSGPGVDTTFNDKNLPEPGSYISSMEECDYLIDLFSSTDCRENDYEWVPVAQAPFLNAERTSTLHRIFYLPFLHDTAASQGDVSYDDYVLYHRKV